MVRRFFRTRHHNLRLPRFVLYHTRQLVSLLERFYNVTHIRLQLDFDSLFNRFLDEFPKDIAHILRLPYADGNLAEAPHYAIFNPKRARVNPVCLTLGICPSRSDPSRDVVTEFIRALAEEEICKMCMISRPNSTQSETDSDDSEGYDAFDRPRLIVLKSKRLEEIRLNPTAWKKEMQNIGEVF